MSWKTLAFTTATIVWMAFGLALLGTAGEGAKPPASTPTCCSPAQSTPSCCDSKPGGCETCGDCCFTGSTLCSCDLGLECCCADGSCTDCNCADCDCADCAGADCCCVACICVDGICVDCICTDGSCADGCCADGCCTGMTAF